MGPAERAGEAGGEVWIPRSAMKIPSLPVVLATCLVVGRQKLRGVG